MLLRVRWNPSLHGVGEGVGEGGQRDGYMRTVAVHSPRTDVNSAGGSKG